LAVVVGCIPAGIAGLALQRVVATRLRSVTVIAVSTILWAIVLWWADRRAARNRVADLREVGIGRALLVGLAQPLALIPGTSRSGITISAGLFTGLDRATAARFAFLIGLPVTAAAGLLELPRLLRAAPGAEGLDVLALGIGTSFAAGLAAIWFLVGYLQRRTLLVFVVYRIILGLLLLGLART
jgi:undecaprenyl-diphosphatase